MAHRLDLIQFQLSEIQVGQFKLNEDEDFWRKKSGFQTLNGFMKLFNSSYNALQGEQKGLDWIGLVMGNLEDAAT